MRIVAVPILLVVAYLFLWLFGGLIASAWRDWRHGQMQREANENGWASRYDEKQWEDHMKEILDRGPKAPSRDWRADLGQISGKVEDINNDRSW